MAESKTANHPYKGSAYADRESQKINDMASLNAALLGLNEERAVFCLRALMLAGHVSPASMKAVLALADTVKFDG